jgi:type IV pilus assembly protein PilY1
MNTRVIAAIRATGFIAGQWRRVFRISRRGLAIAAVAGVCALAAVPAPAAQLNLANTPLFLTSAVKPNIFFMLDDSGSMDWETLYNGGTNCNSASGRSYIDFTPDNTNDGNNSYLYNNVGCANYTSRPAANQQIAWERLILCPGFNTLAYVPTVTYTPWKGRDNANVDYKDAWLYGGGTDAAPNWNVRTDPYLAAGGTTNLNVAGNVAYRAWNDANANGSFDAGECGDATLATADVTFASLTDAQKKNFANWYMYYRKREYVLKRAVTELVKNSRERMGMSTLHRNNAVGVRIENVDDISIPVDATAAANKIALLNNISRINSSNGTPLRDALDNVGRYYEGIAQTALFGANPGHTGTFNANSPILNTANGGACQQNFTVLMTDGYYNGGYAGTNVGNADGNASSAFDSGNTAGTWRPYGDNQSSTLGDIAMYYYERDLAGSLANNVPYEASYDPKTPGALTPGDSAADDVVNNDPNHADSGVKMHQHVVTYTVAFGLSGNLDPFNSTASACDSDPKDACWNGWPAQTPAAMEDTAAAVDDLWHAAYNGRGSFLSAKNPTQLIDKLSDAIQDIQSRTGTAASIAASTSSLSTTTRLYMPQFKSGDWSGSLLAMKWDTATAKFITANDWLSGSSNDAGAVLQAQNWNTGRNILTSNGTTGIPFRWGSLSAAMQTALNKNPSTGLSDAKGSERLEYLRGDHSKEAPGGIYRARNGNYVLGDIVNSSAVYVGAPNSYYSDSIETAPWSTFRGTYAYRTPMIYVGANDGMLHGFAACTSAAESGCNAGTLGVELLAYVPNRVYGNLSQLTSTTYTHAWFVDGTPVVSDVFYGGAWHTVLVGSLRGGGQGIFALDVTNPSSVNFAEGNAASVVRWEFTDTNDADLGYTFSQPFVAKTNTGQWGVIFGNGYNNSSADGTASTNGHAVLFVVNVADGTVIRKIDTMVGSTTTPNGLATPKVIDFNADGRADFAFAGDLQGNLWKFDLRNSDPVNWTADRLFTATDPTNAAQPITSRPEVTLHPDGQSGFMVYFGTGKYLEGAGTDIGSTQVQTLYGIWDMKGAGSGAFVTVNTSQLLSKTTTTLASGARTTSNNTITTWGINVGQYMGWRKDLPETGERVIFNPQYVSDGRVLFVTNTPSTDPCAYGGTSWLVQLQARDGSRTTAPVWDTNSDGEVNINDNLSGQVVSDVRIGTGIAPAPIILDTDTGRVLIDQGGGYVPMDRDPNIGPQSWRQPQ